jgi:hypothetical protein
MSSRAVATPPPGDASARRGRQEADQAKTRRRVGPALFSVMAPGEQILAGALGWTGRWRGAEIVSGYVVLALYVTLVYPFQMLGTIAVLSGVAARILLFAIAWACALVSLRHRWIFLAVTDRQLIWVRSPGSAQPWAWVHAPLDMIRLRGGPTSALLRSKSVTIRASGLPPEGLQFNAAGPWLADLDRFVAEMQAAGFRVGGYGPGPAPQR